MIVQHLDVSVLGGGFAEDRIAPLDEGFPVDKEYLQDIYDYDSDSDLESENEYEDNEDEGGSSSRNTVGDSKGKQVSGQITNYMYKLY
jgi:hypothetical protein